jgi:acetylornithine deacetylase/succinyl-diaminopimelate desuccinylase-like protein
VHVRPLAGQILQSSQVGLDVARQEGKQQMVYNKNKLLKIVSQNEEAEIRLLKRLVNIPTCVSKHHDMKPIVSILAKEFKEKGYNVRTITMQDSDSPVLVAEMNLKMKKTLMFYNHYDVQPEEPIDEWKSPPYTLTMKGGRLFGRGTKDNKGALVANIYGVQAAIEANRKLRCNIRFIVEGEEEAGSPHLEQFGRKYPHLLKSDGCIWEEAYASPNKRSEIYAGVKGDAYFELHARGAAVDAHSGNAPIVTNPAWRLVWALSTLKNEREEILVDGYFNDVIPPRKKDLQLFKKYPPNLTEQYKQLYKTDNFLLDREGVELWKELLLRPTCTISGLSAGYEGPGSKTVIGKEAVAKLDLRLVPNQKVERVQKLLRNHLDRKGFSDIEVKLLTGYEPSRTLTDHPFIKLLAKSAKDFTGIEPVLFPSNQGSGPAYVFGPHTPWAICSTPDPKENTHAPNESIELSDFRYMTAFIGAIATQLGAA